MSSRGSAAPARQGKIGYLRYHLVRDRVLRFAEHAIGGWAPTLRAAFVMMALFVAVVVLVGITLGFDGALVGALVSGVALYRTGRSQGRERRLQGARRRESAFPGVGRRL